MSSCLEYYYKLISSRDYSRQELIDKAVSKGWKMEEVNESIENLIKHKFIDDRRLAENIIEHKSPYYGPRWVSSKLMTRKIDKDIMAELDIPNDPDMNYISKIINSKYAGHTEDYKIKNKALAWLSRRGFLNVYELYNQISENS